VAVEGGVVKYYRNSTLVYTSTVTPQYPLLVDTSLNTQNASLNQLTNVVISSSSSPPETNVRYLLSDVQGSEPCRDEQQRSREKQTGVRLAICDSVVSGNPHNWVMPGTISAGRSSCQHVVTNRHLF
jgi:hypothetical protein